MCLPRWSQSQPLHPLWCQHPVLVRTQADPSREGTLRVQGAGRRPSCRGEPTTAAPATRTATKNANAASDSRECFEPHASSAARGTPTGSTAGTRPPGPRGPAPSSATTRNRRFPSPPHRPPPRGSAPAAVPGESPARCRCGISRRCAAGAAGQATGTWRRQAWLTSEGGAASRTADHRARLPVAAGTSTLAAAAESWSCWLWLLPRHLSCYSMGSVTVRWQVSSHQPVRHWNCAVYWLPTAKMPRLPCRLPQLASAQTRICDSSAPTVTRHITVRNSCRKSAHVRIFLASAN